MKTRILQILGVAAVTTVGMVACDTDACKDVECGANGVCVEGVCVCDDGYEGTNCDTEERADFIGNYLANETACGLVNYNASIATSNTGVTKIAITGFGGWECNGTPIVVIATVNGDDLTVDANQPFCSNALTIDSGTGSINASGTTVTITYNFTNGGVPGSCTTVYTVI